MGTITLTATGFAMIDMPDGMTFFGTQEDPPSPRGYRRIPLAVATVSESKLNQLILGGGYPSPFPNDMDLVPMDLKVFPASADGLVRGLCWLPSSDANGAINRVTMRKIGNVWDGLVLPMNAYLSLSKDHLDVLLEVRVGTIALA